MITEQDKAMAEQAAAEMDDFDIVDPQAENTLLCRETIGHPLILSIRLLDAANTLYAVINYCQGYDALANELGTIAKALEDRAKAILAI